MPRVFISLRHLDSLIEQGQATLGDKGLTTAAGETFRLGPAVHFVSLVGSETDVQQLLGRVKSEAQLEELRAEHYPGSVIVGDVAYQVVEGFLGERVD
jgi:hypothetical protein